MSYFLKQTAKGDKYYEVFYTDDNGKKRHCKYALSRHGKYAEMLAKYTNEHKKVLKQWYDIFDDYFIVNMYNSNEDKYYKCYVDLDDYDLVTKYYWYIQKSCHEIYACTSDSGINGKHSAHGMHSLIMGLPENKVVNHIHGNGLNNRKNNLRVATVRENNKNRVNMNKTNKTGTMGMHTRKAVSKDGTEYLRYCVQWVDNNDVRH